MVTSRSPGPDGCAAALRRAGKPNLRVGRESWPPVSPRPDRTYARKGGPGGLASGRRATAGGGRREFACPETAPAAPVGPSPRSWPRWSLTVAVFAFTRGPDTAPITASDVNKAVQDGIAKAQEDAAKAPPDAAAAYRIALPSLVTIATQRTGSNGAEQGTGAGVVVSGEGTVLTALHVVQGATSIEVTFSDGTSWRASRTRTWPPTSRSSPPDRLPQVVVPAVLGGGAQVGDAIFALGHPSGAQRIPVGRRRVGARPHPSRSTAAGPSRTYPVRRRRQPRQLRRTAAQQGRAGRRHRHRARQPLRTELLRRASVSPSIATAGGIAGSPPQSETHRTPRRAAWTRTDPAWVEQHPLEQALYEVKKIIVGQEY